MADQPQPSNLVAIKERQQKAWSSGDYVKVSMTLVSILHKYPLGRVLYTLSGGRPRWRGGRC
jgi:hypothetical protein